MLQSSSQVKRFLLQWAREMSSGVASIGIESPPTSVNLSFTNQIGDFMQEADPEDVLQFHGKVPK